MTLHFRLHHVVLRTRGGGESRYDFRTGLNAVVGSYGTGKSSLFELIKYGLGGSAEIMPAIADNLAEVELEATVGTSRLRLVRSNGRNRVAVTEAHTGTLVGTWTTRGGSAPASAALLEYLGVPAARLSRRSTSGATSEPLSFFDLYRYCYLQQNDIDRSVAGHRDAFVDRKRKAVFEMAFGLTDDRLRELRIEASELDQQRGQALTEAETVRRFIVQTGAPGPQDLDGAEADARSRLAKADAVLRGLQADASAGSGGDAALDALRDKVRALRRIAADAQADADAAHAAVTRDTAVVAQLELDAQRDARSAEATRTLSGLEFTSCPRCLQDLRGRDPEPGHCRLCMLPQPAPAGQALPAAHRHAEQAAEARQLLAQDRDAAAAADVRVRESRLALDVAAADLEEVGDRPAAPALDAVAAAAAEREAARGLLRETERFRDLWDGYRTRTERLGHIDDQASQNAAEQALQEALLAANRRRIDEFGEVFDEEIRELAFAGYEKAWIDPNSYLPVINGDPFDKLSVGGAKKTLANVGYYMSLLGYTLASREIAIPDLLLIDSPRKNLGNTREDTAAGVRIYYRLSLLAQAYPDAQILLADNGLPDLDRVTTETMHVIELSYGRPLLQDVPHPGPGKVRTVGAE